MVFSFETVGRLVLVRGYYGGRVVYLVLKLYFYVELDLRGM